MKPVAIVSFGYAELEKVAALDAAPEFRKATLNMKLACVALQMALEPIKDKKDEWQKKLTLFLGTGHGEFNSTLEFLKAWAEHRHARPFVFQNSLHNSTTGFLCLFEGVQAPSCTISHHFFSGEDAIDTAQQFLLTGQCEVAAVVGVDTSTLDHLPIMAGAGFPDAGWGQGAGVVILATDEFCKKHSLNILGYLQNIETTPNLQKPIHFVKDGFELNRFYDSNAIEILAKRVSQKNDETIVLEKPNGGTSQISWSKHV